MIYLIVAGFILMDICTGFLKAIYLKQINSTILRKGLFHKLGEVCSLALAYGLEVGADYISIGTDVPFVAGVATYISVMEIISVIENICEINPDMLKFFKKYLDKFKGNGGDKDVK